MDASALSSTWCAGPAVRHHRELCRPRRDRHADDRPVWRGGTWPAIRWLPGACQAGAGPGPAEVPADHYGPADDPGR